MRASLTSLLLLVLGCPACVGVSAQAGYSQLAIDGNIALSTTSGGLTGVVDQDFRSAFGLGDERGAPYVRLQADLGVPVLTLSATQFDEQGSGTLNSQFGNLTTGTAVTSDLHLDNIKGSAAFQFSLGPVAISPGIAVDWIDMHMQVRATNTAGAEDIDVLAPIPMALLRAEASLGVVAAVAEVGYVKVPQIQDVEGTFWDAEALIEVRAAPLVHLFAGYRMLHLDAKGRVDNQDFATDFDIAGWMIGGGVRF